MMMMMTLIVHLDAKKMYSTKYLGNFSKNGYCVAYSNNICDDDFSESHVNKNDDNLMNTFSYSSNNRDDDRKMTRINFPFH